MADELIGLFSRISTTDHDALVEQFSKVLSIDPTTAHFFLDASNWNVETAVNSFLSSVGSQQNMYLPVAPPQGSFLGDIAITQVQEFEPDQPVPLVCDFCSFFPLVILSIEVAVC